MEEETQVKPKLRNKIIAVLLVIVIICAVLAVYYAQRVNKEETIKIGAIISLSGPGSGSGMDVRDGLRLAIDEINSWGGVNGKKIELIIEDSKSNPENGKAAFKKIEASQKPLLYVSTLSSVSVAVGELAEENEVVLVGLVTTSPKLTLQKEWVYRYYPTAEDMVPPAIFTLDQLKVKTMGILYLNDEYGTSVAEPLKEEFEKTGGTVDNVPYNITVTGFKEKIDQLKNMEAIYAVGFVSHIGNILTQLKEENYTGYILTSSAATSYGLTGDPAVTNGVYVAAPIIYNSEFLFAKDVKEKYEARYDKSFSHHAANGYDFIKIFAGLMEDEDVSRENFKRVLDEGFVYSGVFGSIDAKPEEHDITFPLHPAQFSDGELQYWW